MYALYYPSLVRLLFRRTGDRDRAEDLAQDVFVRALEAPPRNPKPWLFAVALNLARDDGRRIARRERHLKLIRAEQEGAGGAGGPTAPGPDQALEESERALRVRAALETLSEADRSALLLRAEGFSYREIAAALGLAEGSMGTTLARARRRLVESFNSRGARTNVAR